MESSVCIRVTGSKLEVSIQKNSQRSGVEKMWTWLIGKHMCHLRKYLGRSSLLCCFLLLRRGIL